MRKTNRAREFDSAAQERLLDRRAAAIAYLSHSEDAADAKMAIMTRMIQGEKEQREMTEIAKRSYNFVNDAFEQMLAEETCKNSSHYADLLKITEPDKIYNDPAVRSNIKAIASEGLRKTLAYNFDRKYGDMTPELDWLYAFDTPENRAKATVFVAITETRPIRPKAPAAA